MKPTIRNAGRYLEGDVVVSVILLVLGIGGQSFGGKQ